MSIISNRILNSQFGWKITQNEGLIWKVYISNNWHLMKTGIKLLQTRVDIKKCFLVWLIDWNIDIPADWQHLLEHNHPLRPHAPYLVHKLYEYHHNIGKRIRRCCLRVCSGKIPIPNYSTMVKNNEKLQQYLLCGRLVHQADPGIFSDWFIDQLKWKLCWMRNLSRKLKEAKFTLES